MERHLKVSVVIPAYNAARTIARALDSVIRQTETPDQILVVDDGSTDDLSTVVDRYRDSVTLLRKSNGGVAEARNYGIDHTSGDLIAFLDADDYWEAHSLERQVAVFARFPIVGLSCALAFWQNPGQAREPQPAYRDQVYDTPFAPRGARAFLQATRTWTSTVVVRRSTLASDRFRSDLQSAEDRDLWVRIINRSSVLMHSDRLATGVLEPGSLSRSNVDRDCTAMLKVVRSYPEILGRWHTRHWEAHVFRRWAGLYLNAADGRSAVRPAFQRLLREPWSAQAFWVLAKAARCALASKPSGALKK